MTLEKLFTIITHRVTHKMNELEMVLAIQKFSNVSFIRAINGYKQMRAQGMINDVIDKNTIGTIDALETNAQLMIIIDNFDAIPTNIDGLTSIKPINKKSSECQQNEIIPLIKMTPHELSNWISMPTPHCGMH